MSGDTTMPPLAFGFAAPGAQTHEGLSALLDNPELMSLLDHLPVAVVMTGPGDTVRLFNASAESLFGLRRESVLGQPLERLGAQSLLDLAAFLEAPETSSATVRGRRVGGSYAASRRRLEVPGAVGRWTLYHFTPQYDSSANPRRGPRPPALELVLNPTLAAQLDKASIALARKLPVLLLGDSGVGKTVLAQRIHASSARAGGPFVPVNCASIPETLFESEVFGYERGAFTGALQGGKRGQVERAAGGTLLLDEVGEIPLACQAKLLRFLEDGSVPTLGAQQARHCDVAVICATNRDLATMVAEGSFRRDLYYRIASFSIRLPGLQESGQLPLLIEHQLAMVNQQRDRPLKLSEACRAMLLRHPWPGNVRELRHVVEYLSVMAEDLAEPAHLPEVLRCAPATGGAQEGGLRQRVRAMEQQLIADTLTIAGSKREAARRLGIDVATLIRKARDN
jgi:transcriptional regulator with PAS, ATPase and Fis domain